MTSVLHKVDSLSAARALARVHSANKDLIVVEDEFARLMVEEMLRRLDRQMLDNSCVVNVGSHEDVRRLVRATREQGVRVVGVLDPDQNPSHPDGIIAIPGDSSPEELLLDPAVVQDCERTLAGIASAVNKAGVLGLGKQGSAKAKAIIQGVALELAEEHSRVIERLTLSWLALNEAPARKAVESMRTIFASNATGSGNAPAS